jgi:hypothetical protein
MYDTEQKPLPKRSHSTPVTEGATEGATKYRFLHLCTEIEVAWFCFKKRKPRTLSPFIKENMIALSKNATQHT